MSILQTIKALNCSVTFSLDNCVFQHLTMKKTVGVGKCWNGLYHLQRSTNLYANVKPSFDIWHWRLGHLAANRSSFISALAPEVSFSNKQIHTRTSCSSSQIKSTLPFVLIHCDIWGSFSIASNSSAHYFLTIVDDFSHCTWVFLMKYKSETQNVLKLFFSLVSN